MWAIKARNWGEEGNSLHQRRETPTRKKESRRSGKRERMGEREREAKVRAKDGDERAVKGEKQPHMISASNADHG
jgi:hypothetical protein